MREIYLVRHAIAEERGAAWPDDDLRPLTDDGIRRFQGVVSGLDALGVELDRVLSSPLARALETAELLSEGLPGRPAVKVLKSLRPGTPPAKVLGGLPAGPRRLALVGHEPDLGILAAFLIGARRPLPFKKGGVCRIDVPEGVVQPKGSLIWFATPGLLRRLWRQ